MREQPIRPLARLPVTFRNAPLNSTNCCLSQFKEDSGQTSVSAQEINHTAYPWAAPRIFRWGYKTGFASGASEKKNFCTPTFPNVGGTSKQSVGAY